MGSLDGRSALVTGGSTLIGHGVVSALLEAGAEVTVADIDEAGAESVLSLGATFAHTDVTSDDQVQALVDGMHERFGRLDIVVNLATVYLDRGIEDRAPRGGGL